MRRSRRAQRPAPEGVDPHPSEHPLTSRAGEDKPESWGEGAAAVAGGADPSDSSAKRARKPAARGENDDRLRQDRPPHWG